jgi:methylated-DNA-protein-cysteine methyltransferase-like protein
VNPFYRRIYRVVRHIPKGRVATYGVVARLAGRPGAARTVGWALSALPDDNDVPWWRVREGVKFAPGGAVNLTIFGWPSEAYDTAAAAQTRAASSRRSRRLKGLRT